MPDLELRFDERLWSAVPAEADAPRWFAGLLAEHDQSHHPSLAMAAGLALEIGTRSDLSALLLLRMPDAGCYGALSVLQLADVPVPADPVTAARIAQSIEPSEWEPSIVAFQDGEVTGWRISQAGAGDPRPAPSGQVSTLEEVTMIWVLDVGGRLCIARMTPLPVLSAALLLPEIETVLASATPVAGATA